MTNQELRILLNIKPSPGIYKFAQALSPSVQRKEDKKKKKPKRNWLPYLLGGAGVAGLGALAYNQRGEVKELTSKLNKRTATQQAADTYNRNRYSGNAWVDTTADIVRNWAPFAIYPNISTLPGAIGAKALAKGFFGLKGLAAAGGFAGGRGIRRQITGDPNDSLSADWDQATSPGFWSDIWKAYGPKRTK